MKNNTSNSFENSSKDKKSGFGVDIRSIYDRKLVLDTLEFESKEEFAEFARTQCIRPDGYLDLREKDLSNLDLTGAKFCLADLYFTNLTDTKLVNADLLAVC